MASDILPSGVTRIGEVEDAESEWEGGGLIYTPLAMFGECVSLFLVVLQRKEVVGNEKKIRKKTTTRTIMITTKDNHSTS